MREPVDEALAWSRDRLVDLPAARREAERPVAAGRALGRHEDVRPDAPVIDAEPATRPPEAGHDLVRDEQHAVPGAHLGDRRPVVVRRDGRPERGTHDRLGEEGRHATRPGLLDRGLELGGQCRTVAERVRGGLIGAVRVGRRDVPEPTEPRLVWAAQGGPASGSRAPPSVLP